MIETSQAKNTEKTLNILLGDTHSAPYAETAPAAILSTFNAAVLGQLIKTDKNLNLIPGHLESWNWDFETSEYVLKIKKGLKFHSGREVNANDLEFSLLRGFFSAQQSFYRTYLSNIVGTDKIKPGSNFKQGLVDGVKVIDSQTVRVKLTSPNPNFLLGLTGPYFSIVPKEELKNDYISWKTTPVGSGHYRVVEGYKNGITKLEKINVEKNQAKYIYLHTIAEKKDYDISLFESTEYSFRNLKTSFSELPSSVIMMAFSNLNPTSKKQAFKDFIKNAINKSEVIKDIEGTTIADELLPKHLWGRTGIKSENNIKIAKTLIENDLNFLKSNPIRICLFSGPKISKSRELLISGIQKSLNNFGVKIQVETTLNKFYTKDEAERCQIFISGMVCDYIDPLVMFSSLTQRSAYIFTKPTNDPNLEILYQQASNSTQKENRIKSLQKLSQYVSEHTIVFPIAENKKKTLYNEKTISNLGDQNQPLILFLDRIEVTKSF